MRLWRTDLRDATRWDGLNELSPYRAAWEAVVGVAFMRPRRCGLDKSSPYRAAWEAVVGVAFMRPRRCGLEASTELSRSLNRAPTGR